MTEKYKKIFGRVILGTAAFWVLAFLADMLILLFSNLLSDHPREHDDALTTVAAIICIAVFGITLIVCRVKSKKEMRLVVEEVVSTGEDDADEDENDSAEENAAEEDVEEVDAIEEVDAGDDGEKKI